ncbi:MAG: alpha/beta hydrolase [Actinomycetota bacterium]
MKDGAADDSVTKGTEDISFVGSMGHRLSGVLHLPASAAQGSVLMAHCFTCSKDLFTMTRLAKGLADAGFAVLRFDFTGLGGSGGEFSATSVSTNVKDLARAATALIERGFGPCALLGHSLGGAAALLAAQRLKTVRSVAVLAAPSSPRHIQGLLGDYQEQLDNDGQVIVEIAGRKFPLEREFLEDLDRHDAEGSVAGLGRPLLVLHGLDDRVVDISEGERIFARARQPRAFVPLLGADHLLTRRDSAEQALDFLVAWFRSTL